MINIKKFLSGLITGIINGLIGGGAGLICVPLMKKIFKNEKKAHAYSVVTVFFATIISVVFYSFKGNIDIELSTNFIIGGIIAAPLGVFVLKKIEIKYLNKGFGILLIYSAFKILLNG